MLQVSWKMNIKLEVIFLVSFMTSHFFFIVKSVSEDKDDEYEHI